MYFAEVTAEVDANSEIVAVDIFNEELRKNFGDRVPSRSGIG